MCLRKLICPLSEEKKGYKYEASAWIEKYVAETKQIIISCSEKWVEPVVEFVLIWNIFESCALDKKCTATKIWNLPFLPEPTITNKAYSFFKKRYLEKDGTPSFRFECLNLDYDDGVQKKKKNQDNFTKYKQSVLEGLCSPNPKMETKNQVCRMIIWRYRNNLFHGIKEIHELEDQIDMFNTANEYLSSCVDRILKLKVMH